jgi:DNA sulfur modification protein DndE
LPPDVKRIDAPTPWILIQPRVHLPNQSGLAAARQVLSEITTQPLSAYLGKPAPAAPKRALRQRLLGIAGGNPETEFN